MEPVSLLQIRAMASLAAAIIFMFLYLRNPKRSLYILMELECLILLFARYYAIMLGYHGSTVPFELDLIVTLGSLMNLVIALDCVRLEYVEFRLLCKRKKELEEVVGHK